MKRALKIDRESITGETYLRLDVAAALAFPDGSIGLNSLRREAAKGRLRIWRIAGKDMTTLDEIKAMVEKCLVSPNLPASGSSRPPVTAAPSGISRTAEAEAARAAALLRAKRLKERFGNGGGARG